MLKLRHYRFAVFFLMLVIIGGMAFLYYQRRTTSPLSTRQNIAPYKYPKHRLQIQGFYFEGHYEGKRVISIKADKFTVEKKRLGFFRLGLISVARFKNAVIDIYCKREDPPKNSDPKSSFRGINFREAFKREALPSFHVKRISSIVIERVCLNLHDEKSLLTQITAPHATFRFKRRDILFNGKVRAVSGPRVLTTDELIIFPENATIKTKRRFTLETPGKRLEGRHFVSDIFLKN